MPEPRFWVLDFDKQDHLEDFTKSALEGNIACIVDEQAGGIVAYVIDPKGFHRADEFVAALTVADEG